MLLPGPGSAAYCSAGGPRPSRKGPHGQARQRQARLGVLDPGPSGHGRRQARSGQGSGRWASMNRRSDSERSTRLPGSGQARPGMNRLRSGNLPGQARPGCGARPGQGQARPGPGPGQARPGARPGQGQARPAGQARPGPGQARLRASQPGQAKPGQAAARPGPGTLLNTCSHRKTYDRSSALVVLTVRVKGEPGRCSGSALLLALLR
jgi:hypothetical protein